MPTDLQPGEVVSYMEMCSAIGVNLQRGMNFRLKDGETIILIELKEAQIVIEQWPVNYNTKRPHSPGDQIHLHSPWL